MPYIPQHDREAAMREPSTPGELNYAITQLLIGYIQAAGGVSYTRINDCLGACEGAKLELYRRVAVPYENKQITKSGDVYPEEWTR
jgi:hypothetical protein